MYLPKKAKEPHQSTSVVVVFHSVYDLSLSTSYLIIYEHLTAALVAKWVPSSFFNCPHYSQPILMIPLYFVVFPL